MSLDNGKSTNHDGRAARVGYLLRMYPRFSQTFVVNEILEMERQGLDVTIVSLRRPDEGMFHETVTHVRAKAAYLPESLFGYAAKHWKAQWRYLRQSPRLYGKALALLARHKGTRWFELFQAGQLLAWARKQNVPHVHVHFGTDEATVALLAHRLGGLSYSLTLHAFDIFRDNVDRRLLAAKINGSRFTVTVCESNRRYILERIPGVIPEKVVVNYNGIDLSRFTPNGDVREPSSILGVGRLIEKKGFSYLIRAVGRLRDAGLRTTCRIVGDGPEESALRQLIAKHKLEEHVHLVGPVREDRVRELIRQSACFALPCVQAKDNNVDALPTVLLEAQACGCPAVSTRISGVPEIIEHGVSGMLVEPEDAEGLADALRKILTDDQLASRLAKGGRKRAEERFDVTQNGTVMRRWLEAAAAGRTIPKEEVLRIPMAKPALALGAA